MSKQEKIVHMFDEIAKSYDVANRVLSFGVDKSWRKQACIKSFELIKKDSLDIIDVACGTGDMIMFWLKEAKDANVSINSVVGIDPSSGMLEVACKKMPQIEFIKSFATSIPKSDEVADIISISYGIRNVVERVEAIKEFKRVLRKDGLLVILEFTKNENSGIFDKISRFYLKNILPLIGGLVSKNYEAYRYLPDSIDDFLTLEHLSKELQTEGFEVVYHKGFSMNISTLLIAKKV